MTKHDKQIILEWSNLLLQTDALLEELGEHHSETRKKELQLNEHENIMSRLDINLDDACNWLELNNWRM